MIRTFFQTLESLPASPQSDVQLLVRESTRAFDLLIDFLRSNETFPHPLLNRLLTLCWRLIGNKEIPMILDPWKTVPSLHLLCIGEQAWFLMPWEYLDLVRSDPLMQLCAVINMASQGCDYRTHHLGRFSSQRAQAYEAEALLALRPLLLAESLPWKLNPYLEEVLRRYPSGLANLPEQMRYTPPAYRPH